MIMFLYLFDLTQFRGKGIFRQFLSVFFFEKLNKGKIAFEIFQTLKEGEYENTTVYKTRCIGPSWNDYDHKFQQGLVMNVFECMDGPCGGSKGTCLR